MAPKIYTKTGDKGTTSLLGGSKLPKSHHRIDAYGNVDELNSFIGLLADELTTSPSIRTQLLSIQHNLFTIGSALATETGFQGFALPEVAVDEIHNLEKWIDDMEAEVSELRNFILPGGHKTVSLCHVCRTVCRRAERGISVLGDEGDQLTQVFPYMNRLSDYFFVLARKIAKDLNVEEIHWKPRN